MNAGIQAFLDALIAAGRTVELLDPIVVVHVDVPLGLHAGNDVPVGADPPPDFPTVPPHWVHLPDSIDIANGGKQASELGGEWAKWSRPHKRWLDGTNPASQWLAHVRSLLEGALT
jgi:hypothetical protein